MMLTSGFYKAELAVMPMGSSICSPFGVITMPVLSQIRADLTRGFTFLAEFVAGISNLTFAICAGLPVGCFIRDPVLHNGMLFGICFLAAEASPFVLVIVQIFPGPPVMGG